MSEDLVGIPSSTPKSTNRNTNTPPYPDDEFDQYQATSRTESDVKQLILEYQQVMREFSSSNIETAEDMQLQIAQVRAKLHLFESLLLMKAKQEPGAEMKPLEVDYSPQIEKEPVEGRKQRDVSQNTIKKRDKGLQEIFKFYSRQHVLKGRKMNFEDIKSAGETMNQGEFLKFCVDFNIPLAKQDQIDVYRRKALRHHQPVTVDNFKEILEELFRVVCSNQVQTKQQNLEIIESTLGQSDLSRSTAFELSKKKRQLVKEINNLEEETNYMDMAHEHLHTANPEVYGKQMKGFYIPFGSKGEKLQDITLLTASLPTVQQKNMKALGLRVSAEIKQRDDTREKIKEQSIGRIHQMRNTKEVVSSAETKAYSLAQLKNLKNTQDLLGEGELETVLGLNHAAHADEPILLQLENRDGYNYSFKSKDPVLQLNNRLNKAGAQSLSPMRQASHRVENGIKQKTNQKAQQKSRIEMQDESKSLLQVPESQANKYYQKIISRAQQVQKVNQSMDEHKRQRAIDQHLRRVKANQSIVESYSDNDQQKNHNRHRSVPKYQSII